MGDPPAEGEEEQQPEEPKILKLKLCINAARSVGEEEPTPPEGGEEQQEQQEGAAEWTSFVSFEWPGEEAPIESEPQEGRGEVQYGFEREFEFPDEQASYDQLATTTLCVSLKTAQFQENPKTGEKEKVEGSEAVYGSVELKLGDLLGAKSDIGGWLDLELTVPPPEPDENELVDLEEPPPPPGLEVVVVLNDGVALFTEEDAALTNSMTLALDNVYSLPEEWVSTEGKEVLDADLFDYKCEITLPIGGVPTPIEAGPRPLLMPTPSCNYSLT